MSHDLGFFTYKKGAATEEIRKAYLSSCEGSKVEWPVDSNFNNFVLALENQYPQISSYPDDEVDNCPWASDFDKGKGHLIVSMVFSRSQEVGNFIWEILQKYKVIVYDPQLDKAFLGNNELPETTKSRKWWQFWEK